MFRYTKILGKAQNSLRDSQIETATVFQRKRIKKSVPTICRQKFFLHFEIKFNIFRAIGIGKMFHTKSSVLMSKWSITSQLSKMIGSNFYHMLVILTFLFPVTFIKFGCIIYKIGF